MTVVVMAGRIAPGSEASLQRHGWADEDGDPCGSWASPDPSPTDVCVQPINLPYMRSNLSACFPNFLVRSSAHENTLHCPIPVEIRNCTHLRAIYLRDNNLQRGILPEFGELVHPTILELSSCRATCCSA